MNKTQIIFSLKDILSRNDGALETVYFDQNNEEKLLTVDELSINFIEEDNGSIFFDAVTNTGKDIYNNLDSLSDVVINKIYFLLKII